MTDEKTPMQTTGKILVTEYVTGLTGNGIVTGGTMELLYLETVVHLT
jgi:hypothetical protein